MAAVLGLIIGVVIGVFVRPDIPIELQPYLPIMVLAALDALLGAARAYFQRSFSDKVFVILLLECHHRNAAGVPRQPVGSRLPAADRSDRSARHTNLYQCVLHSTLHL
mgnify:CR=1 FL=1